MALQAYLVEYEQCQEGYRFTYTTIWQAGSIFVAASAAIFAIAASGRGGADPVAQVVAPLPFLFWWIGVFRPMHYYGELKSKRLGVLEELLSALIAGLDMRHFRKFNDERTGEGAHRRSRPLHWIRQPRVSQVVNLIGMLLALTEVILLLNLLWNHFL